MWEMTFRKRTKMISSDKLGNALYTLQGVLIYARSRAGQSASMREIVSLLDAAEYLPYLIARKSNDTALYREFVADIAQKHGCPWLLQRFDEPIPQGWNEHN